MAESLDRSLRAACLVAAGASALPLLVQMPLALAGVMLVTAALGAWSSRQWPAVLRVFLAIMIGGLVLAAYDFRIGRDTASAGLLAMLMLKPAETFSTRDARSLLGFALFAPFTAFLQDQGPVTMLLCLPAVVFTLVAWAMLAQQGTATASFPRLFRQAGFALLVAIPMALAGFWLFPRLASPLWGLPELSQKRLGLGDRMTPNEWLDVLVDDSPAMRVRFLGPAPPRAQMYWRGPVLTRFDGEAWTRGYDLVGEEPPRLLRTTAPLRYEATLEPTERRDVVTLDVPLTAPPGTRLNHQYSAIADAPVNSLLRYIGESSLSPRSDAPLGGYERGLMLQLPPDRDPRLRARAQAWRAQTPDPLQLSNRFLDWVRTDFEYTLSAPPVGFHASDEFMFDTKQGFCQHFSSAYVVFMRAAGVPARIVTGYAGGYYNAVGGYWLVFRKDAHAWAEIWVAGRGWVRVDPTAAVAPENILDTIDDLQAQQGGAAGLLAPMFDIGDTLRRGWNDLVLGFDSVRQRSLLRPLGIRDAEAWQLVLAFGIGAGVALAFTLWLLLREHQDRSDPLVRAWRQFTRRLRRAGIHKAPNEGPLSFGERVAVLLPANAERVRRLSQRYSDWRYGEADLPEAERDALSRELRGFRVDRPAATR